MELVAIRDGFHGGARVRRGESFNFDENEQVQAREKATGRPMERDGKPVMVKVKPPRWAKPKAEAAAALAESAKKHDVVDTKPLAAAAAAKRRASAE